ncbi:MAG: tetratricopeptide repeat protein, partial [Fibrobacter sp.]|nr:tetratricopeptide repeat protein [Fibrobacter sp.]
MPRTDTRFLIVIILMVPFCLLSQTIDYLSKGNDFYRQGDYANAINYYQKAIKNNENPALSWFNLGNAFYQKKNPQKTISCYEIALTEAPEFARCWVNLG